VRGEKTLRGAALLAALLAAPVYGQRPPDPAGAPADRGKAVMEALSRAYPDRLGPAQYRDGDWAVSLEGVWFYYAGGRLLPEALRRDAAAYDPHPFYNYPAELPPWKPPGREEDERLSSAARRRSEKPPNRSSHFYDALWRARTKAEAYQRVKTIRFLGRQALVHYSILEELALVEEAILEAAKTDRQVRAWIDGIGSLSAWNWRGIADTQSRSFHAYGAALDIQLARTGGKASYWLWTAQNTPRWWAVPYSERLHPPQAVIKAFEA